MQLRLITLALVVTGYALSTGAEPRQQQVIEKTFPKKELVKIWTMAGNVRVAPNTENQIRVRVTYAPLPRETFEAKFEESGTELSLREHIEDSYDGGSSWTLLVPENIKVECTSVAGDFEFFEVNGAFFASTKAGDITIKECRGNFDVHATTGDIEARGIRMNGTSTFASLSGSVTVALAETPTQDLTVSSSFDDAILDFNGHPLSGKFEFSAREIKGDIFSPFDFEIQERYVKDDLPFVRKVFTRNQAQPFIQIRTSEGVARLRK